MAKPKRIQLDQLANAVADATEAQKLAGKQAIEDRLVSMTTKLVAAKVKEIKSELKASHTDVDLWEVANMEVDRLNIMKGFRTQFRASFEDNNKEVADLKREVADLRSQLKSGWFTEGLRIVPVRDDHPNMARLAWCEKRLNTLLEDALKAIDTEIDAQRMTVEAGGYQAIVDEGRKLSSAPSHQR